MVDKRAKLEGKARKLIKREYVVWLTTAASDLAPLPRSLLKEGMGRAGQPRPVWFIWDDVIVYVGRAEIDPNTPPAHKVRACLKNTRRTSRNWVQRLNNSARNNALQSASHPLHYAAGSEI